MPVPVTLPMPATATVSVRFARLNVAPTVRSPSSLSWHFGHRAAPQAPVHDSNS